MSNEDLIIGPTKAFYRNWCEEMSDAGRATPAWDDLDHRALGAWIEAFAATAVVAVKMADAVALTMASL